MSDVSQGPGWWLASDGKWYSPEQSPGPLPQSSFIPHDAGQPTTPVTGAGDPFAQGGYGPPPTAPGYGYGVPPTAPGYGYGYPTGYPPYAYGGPPKTNGLAVASLVCSFFFWLYGLGAVLAIVFGFIARSQIKRSGGMQQGKGLALAGIIIGFAGLVIGAVLIAIIVSVVHTHCNNNGNCTFDTTFR